MQSGPLDGDRRTVAPWGLLSTARVNRHILAASKVSTQCNVIAVASRSLLTASEYAKNNDVATAVEGYENLLNDPRINCVYISLPNEHHKEWVLRSAENGKDVLCEKPMSLSVADLQLMFDTAERCGIFLLEGYMYVHTRTFRRLVELVHVQKRIGRLLYLRGQRGYNLRDRPGHRAEAGRGHGGGSLWDVGCYPVSIACGIMRQAPVEASLHFQPVKESESNDVGDRVASGTLVFPGGVVCHIHSGFVGPNRQDFEIIGTEGKILLTNPFTPFPTATIDLWTESSDGSWKSVASTRHEKIAIDERIDTEEGEAIQHLYQGEVDLLSKLSLMRRNQRWSSPGTNPQESETWRCLLEEYNSAKNLSLNTAKAMDLLQSCAKAFSPGS